MSCLRFSPKPGSVLRVYMVLEAGTKLGEVKFKGSQWSFTPGRGHVIESGALSMIQSFSRLKISESDKPTRTRRSKRTHRRGDDSCAFLESLFRLEDPR